MKRLALLTLLFAAPAWAADPVMVFSTGPDRIEFGPGDIAKAEAEVDPVSGHNVVAILMSPDKGGEFTQMTRNHVGDIVDVHVCGVLIISPRIMQPVIGGSVYLTGGFAADETNRLAQKLKTGRCNGSGKGGEGERSGRPDGDEGAPQPSM
jgi:preprotein translocase subunit SecD